MANGETKGATGQANIYLPSYETRSIVLATGVEFRFEDIVGRRPQGYSEKTTFEYLSEQFGADFRTTGTTRGAYTNDRQRVHFEIEVVRAKDVFKQRLETPGLHVVYLGHSRYGRGACFDPDVGASSSVKIGPGDRWGPGDSNRNGLFRMAYDFVPVSTADMEHHGYHFAPVAVEGAPPTTATRHPDGRRSLSRITLPESVRSFVLPAYASPSNRYWGYRSGRELNILLHAGWNRTASAPFDLGAVTLDCKVFCHFGCSSRLHYWRIVRTSGYKGWERPRPPTDRFAYFTTAPADWRTPAYWLYYILSYPTQNNHASWWNSLQYAKSRTNSKLRRVRARFRVY